MACILAVGKPRESHGRDVCQQRLAIQLLSVPCWPELRSQPGPQEAAAHKRVPWFKLDRAFWPSTTPGSRRNRDRYFGGPPWQRCPELQRGQGLDRALRATSGLQQAGHASSTLAKHAASSTWDPRRCRPETSRRERVLRADLGQRVVLGIATRQPSGLWARHNNQLLQLRQVCCQRQPLDGRGAPSGLNGRHDASDKVRL
mmetsp:Transcript_58054/g.135882  ORF Transcript_58054/g.135882 Transcript_58054/m.135882 type:complete len:201 (+) Transcript_58054:576-1178(+)